MLPESVSEFLKNRAVELLGLACIAFGIFVAASLVSFDPYDPSANHVVDAKVKNWGGVPGAYIAGPILELIGITSFILVLLPIIWGWKLILKEGLPVFWFKITMLAFCIPAMAGVCSALDAYFDAAETWPSDSFGGVIGLTVRENLAPLLTFWGYLGTTIVIGFLTLFLTIGMTLYQWGSVFSGIGHALASIYEGMIFLKDKIVEGFVGEYEEEEEEESYDEEEYEDEEYDEASDDDDDEEEEDEEPQSIKKKKSRRKIVQRDVKKVRLFKEDQTSLELEMPDDFQLPPMNLLKLPTRRTKGKLTQSALSKNAELLESVLEDFGIHGEIVEVQPGPVVTLYALEPSPGTKSSRVIGLADDIARSMSAVSARIAVIPGRNAIGIELPNDTHEIVYLKELLDSDEYEDTKSKLPLALGKTIGGDPVVIDLARMPHLLVAGTTGSGKSVGINAMILSLLYKYSPAECRFIMIDPKMLELSMYEDIPHLLTPVVTEPSKAIVAFKWTVKEMENRYRLMSNLGVRNIQNYNQKITEAADNGEELMRSVQTGYDPDTGKPMIEKVPLDMVPLPYIVVIVDEMADLMLTAGKEIESSVQRLAQMARAAGIHIILATQRPSVDVITGVIKANFPTRISFQVTSKIDSRTILGEQGAEQLLGMGDMLYMAGGSRITRVHGPFVDDKEVEKVVSFLKKQAEPNYIEEVTIPDEEPSAFGDDGEKDELYDQACAIVQESGKASTSFIQRSLRIGYNRAANIVDQLEREGVVSEADHAGRRKVLVNS